MGATTSSGSPHRGQGSSRGFPGARRTVLPLTLQRAKSLGLSLHLLPPWFDVDTEADLRRLHAQMGSGGGPARTLAFVRELFG